MSPLAPFFVMSVITFILCIGSAVLDIDIRDYLNDKQEIAFGVLWLSGFLFSILCAFGVIRFKK